MEVDFKCVVRMDWQQKFKAIDQQPPENKDNLATVTSKYLTTLWDNSCLLTLKKDLQNPG